MKAAKEGRMWGWKPPRKEWEERSGLVLTERSPLPGAAAEASTPTVGVGASALSRTGLALIGVVRCVELNTSLRSRGSINSTSHSMGKGNGRRCAQRKDWQQDTET